MILINKFIPVSNSDHQVVSLTWDEIEEILGHPHAGSPADDQAITAYLLAHGAPDWVSYPQDSGIDEESWYLVGPEIDD